MPKLTYTLKAALLALPLAMSACAELDTASKDATTEATASTKGHSMRWDHRPESDDWHARAIAPLEDRRINKSFRSMQHMVGVENSAVWPTCHHAWRKR